MEIIRVLKEGRKTRTSVRRKLRRYGISNEAEFTQPLADMQPEKALMVMVSWLALNAKSEHNIRLRVKVPEEQTVYTCVLHIRKGIMYAQHVYATPRLMGKYCINGTLKLITKH